jgi:aconitate hydratase 2/2-methylisocitrate dehydratase
VKAQYLAHQEARTKENLPPLALNAEQVKIVIENLIADNDSEFYLDLLVNRTPAGVDEAAFVKAAFLTAVAKGEETCPLIDDKYATDLLGTMLGGYNVNSLVELLDYESVAEHAMHALSNTVLIYDAYNQVLEKSKTSHIAKQVMQNWANASWFEHNHKLPEEIKLIVFKVDGETNTDDLSPATQAFSRPDIPLHAKSMLEKKMDKPLITLDELKKRGDVVFVGDVVGTGSSRKSAINSILWHIGRDIPFVPNKKTGGFILGNKIAPIFFNTAEDSGVLPIECNVDKMQTGDEIIIHPYDGKITKNGEIISEFELSPSTILDEVRAGGRINLIIGRALTDKARVDLGLEPTDIFVRPESQKDTSSGYTLAQKIVGRACSVEGIKPGTYCEPRITTVGSQDTTGAMTRDELKELACLGFSADLVMQSFCHTAAYPKPVDVELQHTLPDFFHNRGGVALKPGDGVIHSWLNRMLLPDTVGTGGDSHTRFPLGISFPAGSGLVAFAASLGVMPLDMPESVLVRFSGTMQDGITLRDLVNAIPYYAIKQGLLTVEKQGKKNIFSGNILEIEGLEDLTVEQAFELSDASAERSAAACTINLSENSVAEYLQSNIALLTAMIDAGYKDKNTLKKRITDMQKWLKAPELLRADKDAQYAAIIEIDLSEIKEPILACPNDPDDVKLLSEIGEVAIDEVFIGSCMTNIGHFRAATKILANENNLPAELWIAPPTKMDEAQLKFEGSYKIFEKLTNHTETPGCSLCMGNQARVADNATVVSTSTRNFPNRLGDGANVYLGSAELAAITAKLGKLPSVDEYKNLMNTVDSEVYTYLSFDKLTSDRIDIKTVL